MKEANKPIEWSSRWMFILATTSAAVGLGNIWKFPYIAGENGGGAFVLVYLACVVILGIPIMMAEILIGRRGRQNPIASIRHLALESKSSQQWQWVGLILILAGFFILSYYSVVAGWALDYVFQAGLGHFNQASAIAIHNLFEDLVINPYRLLFWHTLIMASTLGVIAYGVEKGIERSIRFMFPTMLLFLLIIAAYSVKTGYFGRGLEFLFAPNFDQLSTKGVLIALGHAFFTLSVATGSIMMYGAYVPKGVSIFRSTFIIAGGDTLIALLAGLAIFPIVFAHGLEPGAGPGLIFKTLPIAFGHMLYGQFFATLFFIMLVFAAFTSAIALLEPSVAWTIEKFKISRKLASLYVGILIWLLGFCTVFSFNIWSQFKVFGLTLFDLFDYLTANIMLPLGALMIALFVGWKLPKSVTLQELPILQKGHRYHLWFWVISVVAPVMILLVFLNSIGVLF